MRIHLYSFSFGVALAVIAVVGYAFVSTKNYDTCVIEKMRNLDASMAWKVTEYCERRHRKEIEIPLRDIDVSWAYINGAVDISVKQDASNYRITRGKFSFSSAVCNSQDNIEFSEPIFAHFKKNKFKISYIPLKPIFSQPACMRTAKIWGTRK